MTDQIALWIGYIILYAGGALLCAFLLGLSGWIILEWWWRRCGDAKLLVEFIQWKRGRYPG